MKKCVAVAFCALLFSLAAAASDAAVTLKMGNKMPENHHESLALRKFADLVSERTNGAIKVQIYYGEVLGDSKKQVENLINGLQDFYADGYGFYEPYVKDFRAMNLPYLFKNNEDFRKFLLSDVEKGMEEELLKKVGLRVINTEKNWLRGPYRVLASKRPVKTIEDLKGLKLRMPPNSPTSIRAWDALGAAVSAIPYSETYLALKQGTVEAVTCPVTDVYYQKFCEVAPYISLTYEYFQQVAIVMNEKRFQSFSPEQREIIIRSINEAGRMCWDLATKNGEDLARRMKDEYKVEFIELDTAPIRQKMEEFAKQLETENYITPGLVEKIKNLP